MKKSQGNALGISIFILILTAGLLFLFSREAITSNPIIYYLLIASGCLIVVSFFVPEFSYIALIVTLAFAGYSFIGMAQAAYVQSSSFAGTVEQTTSGIQALVNVLKNTFETITNPQKVLEEQVSGEEDVPTKQLYSYHLNIYPSDSYLTLHFLCVDKNCTSATFDKLEAKYVVDLDQPYELTFQTKCYFKPRTNCLKAKSIEVDPENFSAKFGINNIFCIVDPEYNYTSSCLDKNGGILYDTITGKVTLSIKYNGFSDSTMYFLVVSEGEALAAKEENKDIYTFLGLDSQKYFISKYIGTPGSYVTIGLGTDSPIVLNEEYRDRIKFNIVDEEGGLKEVKTLTIELPGWLEIRDYNTYSCMASGVVTPFESAAIKVQCEKEKNWVCDVFVDNSRIQDIELEGTRIYFEIPICIKKSEIYDELSSQGYVEGVIKVHYEYIYLKNISTEFSYIKIK